MDTGSPDALCPELASTRAAVQRRLGGISVPGSSGFRAIYTIGHAPVGSPRDFVRLELFSPEGALLLTRDLPLEGDSCGTMAEVIALVLDRYFRGLPAAEAEASEPASEPPSSAAPSPSPAQGASEPEGTGPSATPASRPSAPASPTPGAPGPPLATELAARVPSPTRDRLDLLALELAFRSPAEPALGVRGLIETWPHAHAGRALHVGLVADTRELRGGGEVSGRNLTWRVHAGWGPQLGTVRTYVGPALCFELSRGTGSGLPREDIGYRALLAAGLEFGALWIRESWSVGVSGALDVSIPKLGGRFYIDGNEVLAPEPLRAGLGVGVGRAF